MGPANATLLARRLRREMTQVEGRLWARLRMRQVGRARFRRQVPIGPYVVDFACPTERLVVEVDGPWHDERADRDRRRDGVLRRRGLRVLRYTVQEVDSNLDGVVEDILSQLTHAPSPPGGEGRGGR